METKPDERRPPPTLFSSLIHGKGMTVETVWWWIGEENAAGGAHRDYWLDRNGM
jgi:hypothetical protein